MKLYLDRRCGIAASCGPYLSHPVSLAMSAGPYEGGQYAPDAIVIQLKEGDSQQFHVFRHGEDHPFGQGDHVELLALFWLGDVRGDIGVLLSGD